MSEEESTFWARSGYGVNTGQPYVEIEFMGNKVQVSPENARAIALNLLDASEAAISDGFLVEFMEHKVGLEIPAAASILTEFRQWRKIAWQSGNTETRKDET